VENYRIDIKPSAENDLGKLPAHDRRRIISKIYTLAADPRSHGCEKLTAHNSYRVRQGVYRVVYEIDDRAKVVTVAKIAHRKEAYR